MFPQLRHRRKLALASALVLVVSAVLSAEHTHGANGGWDLVGWFSRIPISVIANPDRLSSSEHWHAGTTSDQVPCAVCMLSHQPGSAGCWIWSDTAVGVLWISGAAPLSHVDRFACPPGARAPPSAC